MTVYPQFPYQERVPLRCTEICRTCLENCCFWLSQVQASWNVMAHAQKPDFVFRWNGRVHLNQRGHQFSRLLAAELCASAVVMLDTPWSEVVWRVLATHSIRQFPFASPPCVTLCHHISTGVYNPEREAFLDLFHFAPIAIVVMNHHLDRWSKI